MGQMARGINEGALAGGARPGGMLTESGAGSNLHGSIPRGIVLMLRALFVAVPLLMLPLAANASAQDNSNTRCEQERQPSAGRSLRRGILGGLGRAALGRAGVPGSIAGAYLPVGELLDEAISSLLDCREQQQAATATTEAVRGGVGTTTTWTSETRPNVTGSSSVTGQDRLADGSSCVTVTDIVIIDGEETRAPKRMCRQPGSNRYVRV